MSLIVTVTFDGEAFYPETKLNLEVNKRYQIQIISEEKPLLLSQKDVKKVLSLLQESQLELEYQKAAEEIDADWELTGADGLADETW